MWRPAEAGSVRGARVEGRQAVNLGRPADVAIVGGGIVGLATAFAIQRARPDLRLAVLDKEPRTGMHQSGHNSGVIHSGVYYRPGSLKARLCTEGNRAMVAFCQEHAVPYEMCGKVIVAVDEDEVPRLADIEQRGRANGVLGLRRITSAELREIEPNVQGCAALHVASTGIVDYRRVVAALERLLVQRGAEMHCNCEVLGSESGSGGLRIRTSRGELSAGFLVNCAGLYADVVAERCGAVPEVRIVPFRGEYFKLRPERRDLVRGLVYPVPDPRFPFLGVHFTRRIGGEVEAGPNAVLAWAREGYGKTQWNLAELSQTLSYVGFRRMASRYWRSGLYEYYRSWNRAVFVRDLRRLVPTVGVQDLVAGGCGVRAQAIDREGRLAEDFVVANTERSVHVLNAPSPAATASLAIGLHVAAVLEDVTACGAGSAGGPSTGL